MYLGYTMDITVISSVDDNILSGACMSVFVRAYTSSAVKLLPSRSTKYCTGWLGPCIAIITKSLFFRIQNPQEHS